MNLLKLKEKKQKIDIINKTPQIIIEKINNNYSKYSKKEEEEINLNLENNENKLNNKEIRHSIISINKELINWNQNNNILGQLNISVQYNEQKEFLILILHELGRLEDLWLFEQQKDNKALIQLRLSFLINNNNNNTHLSSNVQKFRTKFYSIFGQIKINFGETFAFNCDKFQLANSIIKFKLYKKLKNINRPQCLGLAVFRNYLVNINQKIQKHFLQFQSISINKNTKQSSVMSLFPSLLSLSNNNNNQIKQQTIISSSSPTKMINNNNNINYFEKNQQKSSSSNFSPLHKKFGENSSSSFSVQNSQQSVTPRSASGSRRGSTVDDRGAFCTLPQQGGNQPEVLVSLCYFDTQNRLVVCVEKAAAVGGRKKENGSDGYGKEVSIRISAFSAEGIEIGKQKSAWTKSNLSGEVQFSDAQASFQISRNELEECSVQIEMFNLNNNSSWPPLLRRKQKIGTLVLSDKKENDLSSSADAQTHWQEMIKGMGLTLDKWHLID